MTVSDDVIVIPQSMEKQYRIALDQIRWDHVWLYELIESCKKAERATNG